MADETTSGGAPRSPWLGVVAVVLVTALPVWFGAEWLLVRPLEKAVDSRLEEALDGEDLRRGERLAAARALLAPFATPPSDAPWARIPSAADAAPARITQAYEALLGQHRALGDAVASGQVAFVRLLDDQGRLVPLASAGAASALQPSLRSVDDRLEEMLWERAARPFAGGSPLLLGTQAGAWQIIEQNFIGDAGGDAILVAVPLLSSAIPITREDAAKPENVAVRTELLAKSAAIPKTASTRLRAWVDDRLTAPAGTAAVDSASAGPPLTPELEETIAGTLRGQRLAGKSTFDEASGRWRVLSRPLGAAEVFELALVPLTAVDAERRRIRLVFGLGASFALVLGLLATRLLLRPRE